MGFNHTCECLYYILIRSWSAIWLRYLFLSTKCSNRGRLQFGTTMLPLNLISYIYLYLSMIFFNREVNLKQPTLRLNLISYMLIRKYKVNPTSKTFNLHVIDMILKIKCTNSSLVSKGEMCITSHNQLWHTMLYPRIMTTAFLWAFL